MLCQRCHKNLATVRYAEVVDGKVAEQHLCAECMNRQQDANAGFELSGAAPAPRARIVLAKSTDTSLPAKACRSCGTELAEVVQNGQVGCSVCYESFNDALEPVLKGLHVGLRHRGKSPVVDDERTRVRSELHTKRALLRSSLKAENYEEAARLRDDIREIELALNTLSTRQS